MPALRSKIKVGPGRGRRAPARKNILPPEENPVRSQPRQTAKSNPRVSRGSPPARQAAHLRGTPQQAVKRAEETKTPTPAAKLDGWQTDPEPDMDRGRTPVRNMRSKCRCSYVLQFTFRRAASCVLHRPPSQVIHCTVWYFSLFNTAKCQQPRPPAPASIVKKKLTRSTLLKHPTTGG